MGTTNPPNLKSLTIVQRVQTVFNCLDSIQYNSTKKTNYSESSMNQVQYEQNESQLN